MRLFHFHVGALGALRREVIHALGVERGRELLERVGYVQGARDAELIEATTRTGPFTSVTRHRGSPDCSRAYDQRRAAAEAHRDRRDHGDAVEATPAGALRR